MCVITKERYIKREKKERKSLFCLPFFKLFIRELAFVMRNVCVNADAFFFVFVYLFNFNFIRENHICKSIILSNKYFFFKYIPLNFCKYEKHTSYSF